MGLDWDPDGDADRRKDVRKRLLLTAMIVLGILGFVGRYLYQQHQVAERERQLRDLQELDQSLHRGFSDDATRSRRRGARGASCRG